MNLLFNQIRKYTLLQIMQLPLLPKSKAPMSLLPKSKAPMPLLPKPKAPMPLLPKPKAPVILCEQCKKNAVKKAIEESIKFR